MQKFHNEKYCQATDLGFERGAAPSPRGVQSGALSLPAEGKPTPVLSAAPAASAPASATIPMRIGAGLRDRLPFAAPGPSAGEIRAAFAPPRTLGASEELQLAMDSHLEDCGVYGLLQHALDLGLGAAEVAPQFPGYAYLSGLAQNPLVRAGIETTADEMTRRWIRLALHGGGAPDAGRTAALSAVMDAFDLQGLTNRAAALCDYFGGCLVYIDTGERDEASLRTPLMLDPATFRKGSLRALTLIEPLNVYPGPYNAQDPLRPDYFAPTAWWVGGRLIHASRFLYFTANEVPLLLRPAYNFFGIPTAQLALDYVGHFTQNRECASRLLNKFSLTALKTNMSGVLQGGAADDLDARMAYFVQKQSNDGCFVLDKETEDLVKLETPLAGVTDIVRQSLEFVAAVFRLPVTKFLGLSPAGFNPTGEAERRNLYDYLASRQEKVLRASLTRALEVLQMHAFGMIDPELTFEFTPLNPEDDGGGGNGGGGSGGGGNKGNDTPGGKTDVAPTTSGGGKGGNSVGGASTPAADRRMHFAPLNADKNDFKENDHPRDKDGKFSEGGGGHNALPRLKNKLTKTKSHASKSNDLSISEQNAAAILLSTGGNSPKRKVALAIIIAAILKRLPKIFAKQIGKSVGKSFFNKAANEPEEMVDVRKEIIKIENKIINFTVTKDDFEHWQKLKNREKELWEEYGDHYINDEFYRRYFPDDNYTQNRLNEVRISNPK